MYLLAAPSCHAQDLLDPVQNVSRIQAGALHLAGDLLRQLKSYWWLFALGILLATPWPRRFYEKYRATPLVWLPLFAVFWLCLYLIATGTGNPFLYARF